jgi:hypothetical protein
LDYYILSEIKTVKCPATTPDIGSLLESHTAEMLISEVLATMESKETGLNFEVNIEPISGQAKIKNPYRIPPIESGLIGYDNEPSESKVLTPVFDFDGDGRADTVKESSENQNKIDIWFGNSDPNLDPPDFTRQRDLLEDFMPRGLLKSISKGDLKSTDVYIYRESNGQLLASSTLEDKAENTQGQTGSQYSSINMGCEEDNCINYSLYILGPDGSSESKFSTSKDENVIDTNIEFENGVTFHETSQLLLGLNPELVGPRKDVPRYGEQLKVILINRKTGYIGSKIITFGGHGNEAVIGIVVPEITLQPPNLKIKADRKYQIGKGITKGKMSDEYLIGFEGSGLASDHHIEISTEWYDHDGSALPPNLEGYKGRIAAISSKAGASRVNDFELKPGLHTQVVRVPEANNKIENLHFYIHIDPRSKQDPVGGWFSENGNDEDDHRPDFLVPVKVPILDQQATIDAEKEWKKARNEGVEDLPEKPLPVYRWAYRPEFQFSVFDLKVDELRLADKNENNGDIFKDSRIYDLDEDEPFKDFTFENLFFTANLFGPEYEQVPTFGPDRELLFTIDGHSEQLLFAENELSDTPFYIDGTEINPIIDGDKIMYFEVDELSQLQADDYLTLSLIQNGDDANVLWQYSFFVDLDIDSFNDNGLLLPPGSLTKEEDRIEGGKGKDYPYGKIITVNNGDEDGDGIPNVMDFTCNKTDLNHTSQCNNIKFTPIVITLPEDIDLGRTRIWFDYDDSPPFYVFSSTTEEGEPVDMEPLEGRLRIWTKDGSMNRGYRTLYQGGDFISQYETYNVLSLKPNGNKIQLFVEGVRPSEENINDLISVTVDFDDAVGASRPSDNPINLEKLNPGFIAKDYVKVTVLNIGLDVDGNGKLNDANDGFDTYLPGYLGKEPVIFDDETQNMKIIAEGVPEGMEVKFELQDTTSYPGYCGNCGIENETEFPFSATDMDYVITSSNTANILAQDGNVQGPITEISNSENEAWCWLSSRDYGGSTTVNVTIDKIPNFKFSFLLPVNFDASDDPEKSDHMPDLWENLFGDLTDFDDDDEDLNGLHAGKGDGLSAFEEYRGFMIVDPSDPVGLDNIHMRTNKMLNINNNSQSLKGGPLFKDAFISEPKESTLLLNFGQKIDIFGVSWHRVHPQQKGINIFSKKNSSTSGVINRSTAYSIHPQYAIMLMTSSKLTVLGNAGVICFNKSNPVRISPSIIRKRLSWFKFDSDENKFKRAMQYVITHEIGHRLSLQHPYDKYELNSDNIIFSDNDLATTDKKVIFDEDGSHVNIKLKIIRRKDSGHVGDGYPLEFVAYHYYQDKDVSIGGGEIIFEPGDLYTELYQSNNERNIFYNEIPKDKIQAEVTNGIQNTFVKLSLKRGKDGDDFDIDSPPPLELISDLKNGILEKAIVVIWRANTCVMDARMAVYEHNFTLESENSKGKIDLRNKISLKAKCDSR